MKQRPFIVSVMGIVMVVVGLFQVVIGAVTLVNRNDATFLADAGKSSSELTAFAVVLLVFGLLSIGLGIALRRGSKAARMVVGLFQVGQIAGAVYLLTGEHTTQRASAIGTIVGALIVLYSLFGTQKAKEFFA